MKRVLNIVFILILLIVGWLFYRLYLEYRELKKESSEITGRWEELKNENKELLADLEYFSEDANLEKEIRSKFNYKSVGEKLIIVVPPKEENSNIPQQ